MNFRRDTSQSRRWGRRWLWAAGLRPILRGALAIAFPNLLPDWCGISRPNYPEIWQCVGMIVGVYGVGYRRSPRPSHTLADRARGAAGQNLRSDRFRRKLPLRGTFPPIFGLTIFSNDLIRWIPFGMMLWDAARSDGSMTARFSVHAAATRNSIVPSR